jgi:hypothetical protein
LKNEKKYFIWKFFVLQAGSYREHRVAPRIASALPRMLRRKKHRGQRRNSAELPRRKEFPLWNKFPNREAVILSEAKNPGKSPGESAFLASVCHCL